MSNSGLPVGRIVAGLIGALFALYGVASTVGLFAEGIVRTWPLLAMPLFAFAVSGVLFFTATGSRPSENFRRRFQRAILWGLIVGSVAFLCGFFGPMIVTPEANQGPILGIFVTGPIGFVVGSIAGALWAGPPRANRTPG